MTHQKRLPTPKHYPIPRKHGTYVSTIKGSRSTENGIPAVLFLREVTGYAETMKDAKEIIRDGNLLRNGSRIRDVKEGIGILDVVEIPGAEEAYRVVRRNEELEFVPVQEGSAYAGKIVDKSVDGDKFVYRLHSGENYRSEKEYETGNTLVFGDSVEELEFEEGAEVLAVDGSHAGKTGEVEEIHERGMNPDTVEVEGFETSLENLVAVGELKVRTDE